MAGFAVVITFLFWGFILLVTASILAAVLYKRAKRLSPGPDPISHSYLSLSLRAPFLGLAWLVVALFLHTEISNHLAHQSVGYSPDPYVTLPNGFEIGSHNTYDGYIVARGYQTDVPVTGPGYVRSIIKVELKDDVFRGTLFNFTPAEERNFVFNTKTLKIDVSAVGPLTWSAANDEAQAGQQSYWVLYQRYRHTWPTYIFLSILFMGEGLIIWSFVQAGRRTKQLLLKQG